MGNFKVAGSETGVFDESHVVFVFLDHVPMHIDFFLFGHHVFDDALFGLEIV